MKTVNDYDFFGKKVLLRVDFNVPVDEKGQVLDDLRIRAAVPTIKTILEKGAKQLIIMSHLGRPDGKIVDKLKMDSVAVKLMQLLKTNVYKIDKCINIKRFPGEKIVLLENLRFHNEEEENNEEFAKELASYADFYVNDAFGVSHREHASVHVINKFLPSCIGLLMEKELNTLDINKMEKPIVALIGGAKLKTKIPLIQRMLMTCEKVLVGGGMIFTFYEAQNYEIGKSICDHNYVMNAKLMLNNNNLILPDDVVIANYEDEENPEIKTVSYKNIPKKAVGLDIGEHTINRFKEELTKAKTIIWNGPMGYFEKPPFDKGTNELAKFISELKDCKTIVGGGDSVEAIDHLGLEKNFSFISSGGGASLELLSGKELPGIKAIKENKLNCDINNV